MVEANEEEPKKEEDVSDKVTNKYTQRQWDRAVGYGVVPDEYKKEKSN